MSVFSLNKVYIIYFIIAVFSIIKEKYLQLTVELVKMSGVVDH